MRIEVIIEDSNGKILSHIDYRDCEIESTQETYCLGDSKLVITNYRILQEQIRRPDGEY